MEISNETRPGQNWDVASLWQINLASCTKPRNSAVEIEPQIFIEGFKQFPEFYDKINSSFVDLHCCVYLIEFR